MKPIIVIFVLLMIILGGSYFYFDRVIEKQPNEIESLLSQINEKNKQLLAAQILGEERDAITNLIQNNLIDDPNDPLAEKSSIPFLRYLTTTMDRLKIRLVSLTPLEVVGTDDPISTLRKEYIEVPYQMKIIASYKEFGQLLDILEKSPHLIRINRFSVTSDVEQSSFTGEILGRPRQHPINLHVSTLAIMKASSRSESGQYF
ncbi:MAG: hypothetical protein V3W18_00440 [candidate division Zixibacteria bacterium]